MLSIINKQKLPSEKQEVSYLGYVTILKYVWIQHLQNSSSNSNSKQKVNVFFSNPALRPTHSGSGDLRSVSPSVSYVK